MTQTITPKKRFVRMIIISLIFLIIALLIFPMVLQATTLVHPRRITSDVTPTNFGVTLWREVSFETEDGLTLNGWFAPPTHSDGATVLTVHGVAGSRHTFLSDLSFLHFEGYGVLLFDLRNHGTSDGTVTTMSNDEILDVQAAFDFLTQQPEVDADKIVLFGKSMGGAIAIRSMPTLPEARAVMVDTAYTSMEDVVRDGVADLGIPPLFFHHVILRLSNGLSGSNLYEARPIDSVAEIAPRPILFIHGTADPTIPVEHIYELHAAAGEPKELLIVEGAGHIMSAFVEPETYRQRILDFMRNVFDDA